MLDSSLLISDGIAGVLIPDNEEDPLWVQMRKRYGPGRPGVARESAVDWVIRTDSGCVAGGARVYVDDDPEFPPSLDVGIDPRYRRRGYASRIYEAIRAAGIDTEAGSDASLLFGTMTRLGYAFMVGRRSKAER